MDISDFRGPPADLTPSRIELASTQRDQGLALSPIVSSLRIDDEFSLARLETTTTCAQDLTDAQEPPLVGAFPLHSIQCHGESCPNCTSNTTHTRYPLDS